MRNAFAEIIVGIDVSKASLDAHVESNGGSHSLGNDKRDRCAPYQCLTDAGVEAVVASPRRAGPDTRPPHPAAASGSVREGLGRQPLLGTHQSRTTTSRSTVTGSCKGSNLMLPCIDDSGPESQPHGLTNCAQGFRQEQESAAVLRHALTGIRPLRYAAFITGGRR